MVWVQLDLQEEENRLLNMYKLVYNLKNKEEAIRHLINSQKIRIEQIKEENKKYIEQAEQEANNYESDEEDLEAEEELMGV